MRLPTGRRSLLAGGSAAALLVVALLAVQDDDPAGRATVPSTRSTATGAAQADVPVVDVKLELLNDRRDEPAAAERNPFRFRPRPAPPPPPAATPSRSTPQVASPVPAGPPPPPPIPLRFIGLMDAPTQVGRMAILSDGQGHVFYGKEGDIIEGRYKVLRIDADAAELSYVDGHGRQTIRLSGQ